jgi:hypothetical protein
MHRILTGQKPDADRTASPVVYATPNLTRSVRDGVFAQNVLRGSFEC